jgi:hypothetical protein
MTEKTLHNWFRNDFIDFINFQRRKDKDKPMLVLCDGHSSRFSPCLWEFLMKNNIQLICIPAHTSHLLQVLDLYPNSVIKRSLQTVGSIKPKPTEAELIQFLRKVECCMSNGLTKSSIYEGLLVMQNIILCIYQCLFINFLNRS